MRVFKEEQRFTQTWLMVLLSITIVLPIFLLTKAFAKNQINLLNYVIALSLIIVSCALIFIFKLTTRIDEIGIHYRFWPIHMRMKTILWKNIKQAETRTYDALSEYGGWGLKGGSLFGKNGTAINVKGNVGIQLILKDNKKLLIGTQKRSDADRVINRYLHKENYG